MTLDWLDAAACRADTRFISDPGPGEAPDLIAVCRTCPSLDPCARFADRFTWTASGVVIAARHHPAPKPRKSRRKPT